MADYTTISEMLAGMPERKLHKMRGSIVTEINRLGIELRMVDDAIAKKTRGKAEKRAAVDRGTASETNGRTESSGQFEGLPRRDVLAHVVEMKRPSVRPQDVQQHLAAKGIVRTVEAIRVALTRLAADGALVRTADKGFAVPSGNGDGPQNDPAYPLFRDRGGEPGEATPGE
jgi:hypothetical protein